MSDYIKKSSYILSSLVIAFFGLTFVVPGSQPANAAPIIKIAFSSDRVGDGGVDIFVMDEDGSNPVNVSNSSATDYDYYPAWSPDGSKIAFTRSDGIGQIYTMNADGSNQVNISNDVIFDEFSSWSPDGSQIAFTRSGTLDVYTMNADGSNKTNLTGGIGENGWGPSWSPDGSKFVFMSSRDGGAPEIYTMNVDGSNQTRITNNAVYDDFASWSPDGSQIAFIRTVGAVNHVFVMDADGSNQVDLTPGLTDNYQPRWSPDGSKIAFVSDQNGGDYDIFVMNADGSNVVDLTNNADYEEGPDFGIVGDTTVPNNGDANGDGIFDVLQSNVKGVVNPVTGAYAVIELDSVCTASSFGVAAEDDNSDPGFNYPAGLMEFNADCGTPGYMTTVTQYYYGLDSGDYTLRKYIPDNSAYFTIDGASSVSQQTIGGESVTVVSYQVTDGGSLDVDGVADGMIMDPAGLGQSVVSAPNTGLGGLWH